MLPSFASLRFLRQAVRHRAVPIRRYRHHQRQEWGTDEKVMVGITVATCVPCGIYAAVWLKDIFNEEVLKPLSRWGQIRNRDRKPKDLQRKF